MLQLRHINLKANNLSAPFITFHPSLAGCSLDSIFWQKYLQPLLTTTTQKITCIGTMCGFQEMGYFARSFEERLGYTLLEYRKKMSPKS